MKCKCRAKPKPEVNWYRGNTLVKETSKISIKMIDVEEDIFELTMEIKVCTLTEKKKYIYYYPKTNENTFSFYFSFRIHQAQTAELIDVM